MYWNLENMKLYSLHSNKYARAVLHVHDIMYIAHLYTVLFIFMGFYMYMLTK